MPIMARMKNELTKVQLPFSFDSNGESLSDILVKANMLQSGTPSLNSPVYPKEFGDRTENLFGGFDYFGTVPSINDGQNVPYSAGASTDYIAINTPIIALSKNSDYTSAVLYIFLYDVDKQYIGYTVSTTVAYSANIQNYENAKFCRIRVNNYADYGTEYMLNTGSTAKPYEPYGYKVTTSNGTTTATTYLSEPMRKIGDYADWMQYSLQSGTRKIKKLVLTGEDAWRKSSAYSDGFFLKNAVTDYLSQYTPAYCSHFVQSTVQQDYTPGKFILTGDLNIRCGDDQWTLTDWTTWLADQYSAGIPVTVWYVLAQETTEQITIPQITTENGHNTLSFTTELQPSDVQIKGEGLYSKVVKIPMGGTQNEVQAGLDDNWNFFYKSSSYPPLLYAKALSHMFDGTPTTYKSLMKSYFDYFNADSATSGRLTELCDYWYEGTRDNWNGWTEFSGTSGASTGTRSGDNVGKTCVPSTNSTAGQDDFAGLPLFYPVDVNWELAANGDIIITGIDGITTSFERTNPEKLVGVMQQSAYHWESHTDSTFTHGYSAQPVTGKDYCDPLPECYKRDGSFRQFMVHSKYQGFVDNSGYMRCYSGVIPTAWMGVDNAETACKKHGSQYGCESITFLGFLEIMSYIKYASLSQDGINQGCVNYNYQYAARVAETGVKRILITTAQAANLRVGCGVLVGTVGSSNNVDRGTASVYSISGQQGAKITDISEVTIGGTTYAAVTVDTASSFNTTGDGTLTTGNTMISTFAWPTGINDSILGNDGAVESPGSGRYPAKIQGIEYSVGVYETYGDIIMQYNPADVSYANGFVKYYVCNDATKRSSSAITADYYDSGLLLPGQASANWYYIKRVSFSGGVCAPTNITGGSSSTYYKDAMYVLAPQTAIALRSLRSFGGLSTGVAYGGLSIVNGSLALSTRNWNLAARPSANASWGAPRSA